MQPDRLAVLVGFALSTGALLARILRVREVFRRITHRAGGWCGTQGPRPTHVVVSVVGIEVLVLLVLHASLYGAGGDGFMLHWQWEGTEASDTATAEGFVLPIFITHGECATSAEGGGAIWAFLMILLGMHMLLLLAAAAGLQQERTENVPRLSTAEGWRGSIVVVNMVANGALFVVFGSSAAAAAPRYASVYPGTLYLCKAAFIVLSGGSTLLLTAAPLLYSWRTLRQGTRALAAIEATLGIQRQESANSAGSERSPRNSATGREPKSARSPGHIVRPPSLQSLMEHRLTSPVERVQHLLRSVTRPH